ncbi:MAG TPA: undecaprenyldiphospho-muramoylpentapeptide beta-N-acetylglucosaminyltransferase [Flavobacteriales bacterium]|nr:undecaprenyldiphospho-muramoylpentapeptide beta-N-acetylglucosaminyltransferase [Flavobacteriales bacterium]HIK66458.1 undecaprenyldiphospho-muramoylpentapeptide beta-N-acetylglucosaminyltransferase [Flavobacteriales bacterium]
MISRVLISGGGSGGHIQPALAIADEIVRRYPKVQIRFVGAKGRMEMEKVPNAGYEIDGLWISGLQRSLINLKNISFPFKLIHSLIKAGTLLNRYNPEVVIGVGGYASGPLLYRASRKRIPTLIQEQNSFPGITNRILANRVNRVCAGFPGLDIWFPKESIVETGNPLRESVLKLADSKSSPSKSVATSHFNIDTSKPVVFIMGGSLGALSMNMAVRNLLESSNNVLTYSVIWQCGSRFFDENYKWLEEFSKKNSKIADCVKCLGFIDRMDLAYAASDLIASRAGAMSISELALVAKPTLLIPSPNVAEDHQTKNAKSLVDRGAAILIKDCDVVNSLKDHIEDLLKDKTTRQEMEINLKNAARPNASYQIVDEVEKLLR